MSVPLKQAGIVAMIKDLKRDGFVVSPEDPLLIAQTYDGTPVPKKVITWLLGHRSSVREYDELIPFEQHEHVSTVPAKGHRKPALDEQETVYFMKSPLFSWKMRIR